MSRLDLAMKYASERGYTAKLQELTARYEEILFGETPKPDVILLSSDSESDANQNMESQSDSQCDDEASDSSVSSAAKDNNAGDTESSDDDADDGDDLIDELNTTAQSITSASAVAAAAAAVTSSVPKKGGGSAEEYKPADSSCKCQIRDCNEDWCGFCGEGSCDMCFCNQHLGVHQNRCAGLSATITSASHVVAASTYVSAASVVGTTTNPTALLKKTKTLWSTAPSRQRKAAKK
jgi:hypothetical protein